MFLVKNECGYYCFSRKIPRGINRDSTHPNSNLKREPQPELLRLGENGAIHGENSAVAEREKAAESKRTLDKAFHRPQVVEEASNKTG